MERGYTGDVIAAIATPAGRGAIGVVRLSGAGLDAFYEGILGRIPQPRYVCFCSFFGALGEVIDSGIALRFAAPHSFTGEEVLELQGHGGPAVMRAILARCLELGARLAQPGEFSKRAFLNGKMDLAQAESVADLIEATTEAAARAAVRSLRGEFSARVRAAVDALVQLRALTEATLDFPDEDVELLREADARGQLASLRAALRSMLEQARRGQLLREGLHMALIGRPNVGKSSLLNRLAGDDIAIVTPVAGTTRDTIRLPIEIAGVPVHLIDTAGLRETSDVIERLGMERTWRAVAEADVAVLIVDDCVGILDEDRAILGRIPSGTKRVLVHNKIDLSGGRRRGQGEGGTDHVYVSAKTGEGLPALRETLLGAVGSGSQDGDTFIARERHVLALRTAEEHLREAAIHAEAKPMPTELLAEELRLCQEALSTITGEFSADELLGEIFSRFCIGK